MPHRRQGRPAPTDQLLRFIRPRRNLLDGQDIAGVELGSLRPSLARTPLKGPPILVLDKATAMFVPEGESSGL